MNECANFCYQDILNQSQNLKRYIKSKITNDNWKDVYQDTLMYLYTKHQTIKINNVKGLVLNTANFFISKNYNKNKNLIFIESYDDFDKILNINDQYHIDLNGCNSFNIEDDLLFKINKLSSSTYYPLYLQVVEKFSIKEISEFMLVNPNTIQTRIRYAKSFLRSTK